MVHYVRVDASGDAGWADLKDLMRDDVVRAFYQRYEMAPAMRPLVKATKNALGEEKGRSIYLMQLFPGSPAKRIARLAGLPKPTNCL